MASKTISILLVEDEMDYAQALRELLCPSASFHITHARTFSDAQAALTAETFHVILLDLVLPDNSGLNTFTDLRAAAPDVPIIVITGTADESLALQSVREGAQDYLVKGQLDGKTLERSVRYAIERRRAESALRSKDEFFRLISESVSDMIAVLDRQGRRVYNSPSYRPILGDPQKLAGTNSFDEVHPEDRERIVNIFNNTLETGQGVRTEYRMLLKNGAVRHIESQGNVVRDESNQPAKVVVVSRDVTERKASVEVLREALSDLKRTHEELKAAQFKLIQAEKMEAVSTFAAGVAHEVKNPLQTILMGLGYISHHISAEQKPLCTVVEDMVKAVQRADGVIRGMLDFTNQSRREVREEDLSPILKQAIAAVQPELANLPILLSHDLPENLPPLMADFRSLKHVFINLLMHVIRNLPREGGRITVRTHARVLDEPLALNGKTFDRLKQNDTVLWTEIEDFPNQLAETPTQSSFGLTVLKKMIEIYSGIIEVMRCEDTAGTRYVIVFKAVTDPAQ